MSNQSPQLDPQLDQKLAQHRQQFPGLINKVYGNYGGQGPLPQAAIAALRQAEDYVQQAGPFSNGVNVWANQEAAQLRQAIASELQAPVETITLTENVSIGCNIALWGLDWQAGDQILISDCEHPGIIAAVQEIQRRFQVEVQVFPLLDTLNQGDPIAVLAEHLQPHTRLVVLSHVLWNTGQVLPLAEMVQLCHQQSPSIPVLVDAAQSVGVLPLNLTELAADFYAFTGHKWWCGPAGVGGLYVRPAALEQLAPTFIGWRGITMSATGEPTGWQPGGLRFEVATSAYGLYSGLRAAIATHTQYASAQERYQRICELSGLLWHRLSQLPGVSCLRTAPPASGLVSFQLTQTPQLHAPLVDFLEARRIFLRVIRQPNCVRACVHYFTTVTEVEDCVKGIQQFLNSQ